ncbi:MAG TPA: fatty acid cis/trans isomerase, partial [Polyangiaceae bacterium]|nr:fatty acid cis/trans isomerase [Polyangiaceae bacterium]
AARGASWREAKQTFDRRCVVCHGCYDAPCQLVLSSFEGMARGASKREVYDGARLFAIEPTRLHIDARSVAAWRKKDFYPVLPEGTSAPAESLLVRLLELKRAHPLPLAAPLPEGFDLGLDRDQQCPRAEEFEGFAQDHPLWGMPYALPGLSDAEHERLVRWVNAGAPHEGDPLLSPALSAAVERWEAFLNQPGLKAQLVARYLYEHLFLASLYFEGDERTFFRVVRSRTPPGEPTDEIATRRPFEDPGTHAFFYRLVRRERTVLAKTHMPYELSDALLGRYKALFFEPSYEVKALPSYDLETAANPFAAFAALPVHARYRFLLEHAHFTLSGFIKGPVCRGQIALDVIEDRFWIAFLDPESPIVAREAELLAEEAGDLAMPAEQGSNDLLVTWRRYARRERRYLEAKSRFLASVARTPQAVTLDQIWSGDGANPNAGLTVLRHFDSATVLQGFLGGDPKTAWVLSYAVLERIHYLLVAGFDVFGNIGHQLQTRMYMDFLRMEAEHNFLLLLPRARRRALVDAWYRETSDEVKDMVYGQVARFDQETGITYRTKEPEHELFRMLEQRLAPVLVRRHDPERAPDDAREALQPLAELVGKSASFMPETSFLEIQSADGALSYVSLLRDSAHTNVAHLLREHERRRPEEDRLTVAYGFVGAYPNALFSVEEAELPAFVAAVARLDGLRAYGALRERFGVQRSDPQ